MKFSGSLLSSKRVLGLLWKHSAIFLTSQWRYKYCDTHLYHNGLLSTESEEERIHSFQNLHLEWIHTSRGESQRNRVNCIEVGSSEICAQEDSPNMQSRKPRKILAILQDTLTVRQIHSFKTIYLKNTIRL